jgi:hypothetical protein
LSEVANFVVAVFEGDCGGVGAGAIDAFEQVGVIVTVFIPDVVVVSTEEVAIAIVGVGKCLVTSDPLFGFNPVEVVVSVFDEPSVAVDAAGEVVELVVCGETIPLGGGFDAESSGDVVEVGGGVIDRIGDGFGVIIGIVGVLGSTTCCISN